MARHTWLDPSPFFLPGGPAGVLLIHGFTGAPTEMRPLAEHLVQHGCTVACPLLPGHGTEPADLNRVRWQDWTTAVASAYQQLALATEEVFVGGLSMGGLLALHLAARESAIRGLLLFAPALRLWERLLPLTAIVRYIQPVRPKKELADSDLVDPEAFNRIWCYESYPVGGASQLWRLQRRVRRELAQVTQPIILFQGRGDQAVRPDSPQAILDHVQSTDTQLVWLDHSGHNLLVDAEHERVFATCAAWIRDHCVSHRDTEQTSPA